MTPMTKETDCGPEMAQRGLLLFLLLLLPLLLQFLLFRLWSLVVLLRQRERER